MAHRAHWRKKFSTPTALSNPRMLSGRTGANRERSTGDGRGRKKNQRYKAGRGRGPHQSRKYNGRYPVIIRKEIPHCHALPLSLAPRGALSGPLPVAISLVAEASQDLAETNDKAGVNISELKNFDKLI